MPPYRANPGGAFNSGLFPAPVAQIDVGEAIRAIGSSASSLLHNAYLRRVAEANRANQSAQVAQERARTERLDRENTAFRTEAQRLQQEALKLRQDEAIRQATERTTRQAPKAKPVDDGSDEMEAGAWLAVNRRNPEVTGALEAIYTANPSLRETPNKAAALLRRVMPNAGRPTTPARTPQATPPRPPNGEQEKSYIFHRYMEGAAPTLDRLEGSVSGDRLSAAMRLPEEAGMRMLTPDEQVFYAAARAFVAGTLRKETGAAFGASEIRDVFSRFIPLSGDSEQVKRYKRANRARQLETMGNMAAPAIRYYDSIRGNKPVGENARTPDEQDADLDLILGDRP